MATIQIQVKDSVLQRLGAERLQQLINDTINAEEFRLAGEHVHAAMAEAAELGIDWDTEFDQARQQAWEEYKRQRGWS